MQANLQDNQAFIDKAKADGMDTLIYMDPKSGGCLLVSGSASSIKLLGEIVDNYEMFCEVVEAIDMELLERWRRESSGGESSEKSNVLKPTNGEHEHAQ